MTTLPANTGSPASGVPSDAPANARRRRPRAMTTAPAAYGEPMVWLTGGALAFCLAMIIGLILLVVFVGMQTFWPKRLELFTFINAEPLMGEVTRVDTYTPDPTWLENLSDEERAAVDREMAAHDGMITRRLVRSENFDLTGKHFTWVNDAFVAERSRPEWALNVERMVDGPFYGTPTGFTVDGTPVAEGDPAAIWVALQEQMPDLRKRRAERKHLERETLGALMRRENQARLDVRRVQLSRDLPPTWAMARLAVRNAERDLRTYQADGDPDFIAGAEEKLAYVSRTLDRVERFGGKPDEDDAAAYDAIITEAQAETAETRAESASVLAEIDAIDAENRRYELQMLTADGMTASIPLDQIVTAYPSNRIGTGGRIGVYGSRWREYLLDEPRDANQAGGVFPAIVGTVLMTIVMSMLVVPFGVMAALYLREYARGGAVVSIVRIAINNLAGVPSIVFGVFGLGFFCYGVGGFIDGGPSYQLPSGQWFLLLGGLTVISVVAFMIFMTTRVKPGAPMSRVKRLLRSSGGLLWFATFAGAVVLIATTPFFDGFFRAEMPNPTFRKGSLIWASFTLALLTLPVVIVATEEALAAVPNSMREGSYACGASKWQTIRRIVLPRAMPGIMTGMILAMARGAGEVAPLMLVGAVKVAAELPFSTSPGEFFGLNRSFMHLGFHIYDLGFKSQNSEAAKPLVFTTTLLLITIVATLNIVAIRLRTRLQRKFVGTKF